MLCNLSFLLLRGYSVNNSLIERVKSLRQKSLERNNLKNSWLDKITTSNELAEKDKLEPNLVYLPVSKKYTIPTPNTVLRSALFGVVGKGNRILEKGVLKATVNGYSIKYSGEQLDQSDLDVWLECIRRSQSCQLGTIVRFAANDFLRSIDRKTGKSQHEWLKTSLKRIRFTDIEISDGRFMYCGSLLHEYYQDKIKGDNCLIINDKIIDCFENSSWTAINHALRLVLRGKQLTQWLYGFYSSHFKPFPIKIETLKLISGSNSQTKEFRRMIKKSLAELSSVTGWSCEIDEKDKVIVNKK